MNNSIITLFVTCCILCNPLVAQTLTDYLKQGAENNPGLRAEYATFSVALQHIAQANALPDPVFSFGYFISPIETRIGAQRAKLSLKQSFPWFGTLKVKKKKATQSANAAYQKFLQAKNFLFYTIKKAYYPIYETTRHIQLQEENLSILGMYKRLTINSLANGIGTLEDVIRIDMMMDQTTTDIQLLNDHLSPLEAIFNRLLNNPEDTPIIVEDTLRLLTLKKDYRKDYLLTDNPLLTLLEHKIKAAEANEKLAWKISLPQWSVGLDYLFISKYSASTVSENGRDAFMPNVSLSLPLFRKKYNATIEAARLTKTVLISQKENTKNTLLSSYQLAHYALEKARRLTTLYASQIKKTQQIIDLIYEKYSQSGENFEEVLRLQQQQLTYQKKKITQQKNFYLALATLDYNTAKSASYEKKL